MDKPEVLIKMGKEYKSSDGKTSIEFIENFYTAPEGMIKEEIIIKRTLIKAKSSEIQNKLP